MRTLDVNPKFVPNAFLQLEQWHNDVLAVSAESSLTVYCSFLHVQVPVRSRAIVDKKLQGASTFQMDLSPKVWFPGTSRRDRGIDCRAVFFVYYFLVYIKGTSLSA